MEKKIRLKPQNERVLVKPIMVENKTSSGLVIAIAEGGPDGKIETSFGEIVAIAEDLKDKHKIGEIVYYSPRAGIPISLYKEKYKLLTDMEILAKFEVDKKSLDGAIRDNVT